MSSKEEREVKLASRAVAKAEDQLRQAMERLQMAQEALSNQLSFWERRRRANARNDIIWQRYLAGERDQMKLATEFSVSQSFIRRFIETRLELRQFGPGTADEHATALLWRARHQL